MKNLLFIFILLASVSFAQEFYWVNFDTLGNYTSSPKYGEFVIPAGGVVDSIHISVYARGEMDLDSIRVQGGFVASNGKFPAGSSARFNALVSKALSIDVGDNVTSFVTDYASSTLGLTSTVLRGYNRLRIFLIPGASGNDKTDTYQNAGVLISVYRQAQ